MNAAAFRAHAVEWINRRLAPTGVVVDEDTRLFAGGLINSIRVLELIAFTETSIGRTIADREIRMDNFRTVRRIAEVFIIESANGGSDVAA